MFGIYTRISNYGKIISDLCITSYQRYKKSNTHFLFNKNRYNYFIHRYNNTWKNERAIEIPIIKKILDENHNKDILEIGNVMSHYFFLNHDVLDKYEISGGVINKDIVNFKTLKKYDLIIGVSTFEHVGWDEKVKDPGKILKSISNIKQILKKNGKIIFTHPLGYNYVMDKFINKGQIKLSETYFMQRISKDNVWKQYPWKKQIIKYNHPFDYANGIVIGVIQK